MHADMQQYYEEQGEVLPAQGTDLDMRKRVFVHGDDVLLLRSAHPRSGWKEAVHTVARPLLLCMVTNALLGKCAAMAFLHQRGTRGISALLWLALENSFQFEFTTTLY